MALPQPVAEVTDTFLREIDSRLPDRLSGLFLHGSICWGEFFPGSDVDFVGLWDELPTGDDLCHLQAAHEATRAQSSAPTFDGFHCTAADLAAAPSLIANRPAFFRGEFQPQGRIDICPVTWHELAERGVSVRGSIPPVHTDLPELLDFTRTNLDTYWRRIARQIDEAGADAAGEDDYTVAWVGLGAARLHHLLTTEVLTSKSGAGRYVRDTLDRRWNTIAREAVRLREHPRTPSLYEAPGQRGRDLADLLGWLIDDGTSPGPDLSWKHRGQDCTGYPD